MWCVVASARLRLDVSRAEKRRLRAFAKMPESGDSGVCWRAHAKIALAYIAGCGVRLTADEVAALVDYDDAVATAEENLAAGDYGEPSVRHDPTRG